MLMLTSAVQHRNYKKLVQLYKLSFKTIFHEQGGIKALKKNQRQIDETY